eukprot:1021055-Prorocentrum_minimum.AAC.3
MARSREFIEGSSTLSTSSASFCEFASAAVGGLPTFPCDRWFRRASRAGTPREPRRERPAMANSRLPSDGSAEPPWVRTGLPFRPPIIMDSSRLFKEGSASTTDDAFGSGGASLLNDPADEFERAFGQRL